MTAAAVCSLLAVMSVFVAVRTFAPKQEKSAVRILHFDLRADARGNVLFRVALFARERPVLAFQSKPGLRRVVEAFAFQLYQREFLPVMFHMTARAVRLARCSLVDMRVIPRVSLQPVLDFGVALQAFETPPARPEIVTRIALADTLQLLVGSRQGARRDLRRHGNASEQRPHDGQKSVLHWHSPLDTAPPNTQGCERFRKI